MAFCTKCGTRNHCIPNRKLRQWSRILEANWEPPSESLSAKPAPRFWGARESCNLRHARKGWFSRLVRPEIAPTFNGLRCQCIAIVLGGNASSRMVIFIQRLGRQNLRRHYSDNHQHRVRDTREQTLKPCILESVHDASRRRKKNKHLSRFITTASITQINAR